MEEDDDAPAAADDTAAVGDENEDNEETTKIGNKSFMLHILDLFHQQWPQWASLRRKYLVGKTLICLLVYVCLKLIFIYLFI